MLAKRHHYLPQFYQNYFLSKDDPARLWIYDKAGGEPRLQAPINTGVIKHFYTITEKNGTKDDTLERMVFGPLDGMICPILNELQTTGARIKPENKEILAAFLAFMYTRNPKHVESVKEMHKVLANTTMKSYAEKPDEIAEFMDKLKKQPEFAGEQFPSVEEYQEELRHIEENYDVKVDKEIAVAYSLNVSRKIAIELLKLNWCLCEVLDGYTFITSDSPLVPFNLDKNGMVLRGGGFGLPGVQVSFPISPTKCLYLDRKSNDSYRRVNNTFVKEINNRTAFMAERFIMSHLKTKSTQKLTEKHAHTMEMPLMDKDVLEKQFAGEMKADSDES